MKKLIAGILAIVTSAVLLTSCGGTKEAALKDGTYKAEIDSAVAVADDHGWQETLTLQVLDGVVTVVDFDGYNVDTGIKKSEDETYFMSVENDGTEPKIFYPELIATMNAAAGDAKKIVAVTGATGTSDSAIKLYEAAIKAAAEGDETVQVVK